jgi:hypothetical protein
VTNVVGGNIKLSLDASLLPISPPLTLIEGTCVQNAESTFVYNCVTDLTERVTFTFLVPALPDYSVLDFTATLFDDNENDCAVDTQSILVAPPASPTPSPGTCSSRSCLIPSFPQLPCAVRNVSSSNPVCIAGRCRTQNTTSVDCESPNCDESTPNGTPCDTCTCACAAMVPSGNTTALSVRNCGTLPPTPTSAPTPTPMPTATDPNQGYLIWLIILSVLLGLLGLAFCCFLLIGAGIRRRRRRREEKALLAESQKTLSQFQKSSKFN